VAVALACGFGVSAGSVEPVEAGADGAVAAGAPSWLALCGAAAAAGAGFAGAGANAGATDSQPKEAGCGGASATASPPAGSELPRAGAVPQHHWVGGEVVIHRHAIVDAIALLGRGFVPSPAELARARRTKADRFWQFDETPDAALFDGAFHHTGEELFYRGTEGSGTIFFTSCNMRCAFCQNGDISTDKDNGEEMEPEASLHAPNLDPVTRSTRQFQGQKLQWPGMR
jgi:hypothetical protein